MSNQLCLSKVVLVTHNTILASLLQMTFLTLIYLGTDITVVEMFEPFSGDRFFYFPFTFETANFLDSDFSRHDPRLWTIQDSSMIS